MKSLTQHFVYQKHISQSFVCGSVVFYDMNSKARKGNNGNRVLAMFPSSASVLTFQVAEKQC